MKSLRHHIFYCAVVILASAFVGCTHDDPEPPGVLCPPGEVHNDGTERYVSFSSLDCYEQYVTIANGSKVLLGDCDTCELIDTKRGKLWVCKTLSDACLSRLTSLQYDYENCLRYRNHRIFDTLNTVQNLIAFVRDYEGKLISLEEAGMTKNSRYCPQNYSCSYGPIGMSDSGDNSSDWFGCVEACPAPNIYCRDNDDAFVCVDPGSDKWHCGAKGSCSNSDPASLDWSGEVCNGVCVDGACTCPYGYAFCESGERGICYDVLHDRAHCGENCQACAEGYVCVFGECIVDRCGVVGNICYGELMNVCSNSNITCGGSCMDCSNILNAKEAACDSETGTCVITSCEAGYHVESYPHDKTMQYCKPNTVRSCGLPTLEAGADPEKQIKDCTAIEHADKVICNSKGMCEVKECAFGFSSRGTYCEEGLCETACGENAYCENGSCQCKLGYSFCENDGCVDFLNDTMHCGGCDLENRCDKKDDGFAKYKCAEGQCVLDSCIEGFHANGDSCEKTDVQNCGAHGNDCDHIDNMIEGSGNCINGKCIYQCKEGYHAYDNGMSMCEENTIVNCLEHEKQCDIPYNESMVCDSAQGCLVEKCISNFHVYLNKCEMDSVEHCGQHDQSCSEHSVCKTGHCQCTSGYLSCKEDNGKEVCVNFKTDNNHCGKCGNACASGKKCINGSCQ